MGDATDRAGVARRGRPSRRQDKAERVLDAAAAVLNADGLTNASLDAVAETLGLTKGALYYYFRNKQDLVYKSYLRAAQLDLAHAEKAHAVRGTGRERFEAFVRGQLSDDNPPTTLASEVDVLERERREAVTLLTRRRERLLAEILADGAADGSLRVLAPALTRSAIIGALNWVLVWRRPGPGELTPSTVAEAYLDVFLGGLRSPSQPALDPWPTPVHLEERAEAAPFDRTELALRRREALVRRASEYFNRNGFDNCTLQDVADALQISRSSLYHYVSSKEELLYACHTRSLEKTEIVLRTIEESAASGISKFARTIGSAIDLHVGPAGPIANYTRLKSLAPDHHREVRRRSERIEAILSGYLRQGLQDGSIRPVDARLARLAFLGAVNWLPQWVVSGVMPERADIAAAFSHLFVEGLAPRPASR